MEQASGGVRRADRRPLLAAGIVATVLVVGDHIPLPGLDPAIFERTQESSPGIHSSMSVLALGLQPLLSVLLFFEFLKLAVPRLDRWTRASAEAGRTSRGAVAAVALGLALLQAFGVHLGLVGIGLLADDPMTGVVVVGTLVAGFSVLLSLGGSVAIPGLALGGFWLLLSLPETRSLASGLFQLFELARFGGIDLTSAALSIAVVPAVVIVVVFSASALEQQVAAAGGDPVRWTPILLWPPILAGYVASALSAIVVAVTWDGQSDLTWTFDIIWTFDRARIAVLALALPLFVFLYARSIAAAFPDEPDWFGKSGVLAALTLAQFAVCAGLVLLPNLFQFPFLLGSGALLIPLVLVFRALYRTALPAGDPKGAARTSAA